MISSHQINELRPTESALPHQNGSNGNQADIALPNSLSMAANPLSNICLAVRFVRFGTYCTVPYKEGLVMESSCLILTVKEDSSVYVNFPGTIQTDSISSPHLVTGRPYAFKIGWHNVCRFEFHVHTNCSVIYLLMSDTCAKKIRETFGLNEQFAHASRMPFYDPGSNEESRKYVTIGLSECRISWIDIVRKYIHTANPQAEVVALTYCEAMDRMRKSAPPVSNVLPHQSNYTCFGQQQQIVQKSSSPPVFNAYVHSQRQINGGGGGNVASISVPVYHIQPAAVRQVPLVPVQIQQYAVTNVFYQPTNIATARAVNNNNNKSINVPTNNPIVNTDRAAIVNPNRAMNMNHTEAYSKVQEETTNDHLLPLQQQQYCQQNASTLINKDIAGSPAIQSSFSQQIRNLTSTTPTVTAPSTTNKHFLQNIVLKVFKKFRGDDGAAVVPVSLAAMPVEVPRSQLEIRNQQIEQQSQISNANESQQASTSSLLNSQANSDFLSNVPENFELIYPSTSKKKSDSISLTLTDVACLEPDAFLNDNIIDFFLKYIHLELVAENLRDRIYVFNSFFYSRLTSRSNSFNNAANANQPSTSGVACSAVANQVEGSSSIAKSEPPDRRVMAAARHRLVRTWTKNVDIFDKDFIIIPINENSHWYLAIICYPTLFEQKFVIESKPSTQTTDEFRTTSVATPTQAVATKQPISSSLDPNFAFEPEDEEDLEEAKEQYEQLKDASMSDSNSTQSQTYQRIPAMTCIIIMDSLLCGSPRYKTVGILRDYLTEEYAQKKGAARPPKPQDDVQQTTATTTTTMPIFDRTNCRGVYPKVPQQNNYSDCGLYVLQFAESFLTEPPDDFGPVGLKKLQNLFPTEKVQNKRAEIRDILVRFYENRNDRSADDAVETSMNETSS